MKDVRWVLAALLLAAGCNGEPAAKAAQVAPSPSRAEPQSPATRSIHALKVKRLDGTEVSLGAWAGKVLLVVNTASECGYTPQYEGLQALHAKYEARGFAVLGFPSNDFGGQEPGSSEQIAAFCQSRYRVAFPMFEKVVTVGDDRAPLYALLGAAKGEPKWNFHKYLLDRKGEPSAAWPSAVTPESSELAKAIQAALAQPS